MKKKFIKSQLYKLTNLYKEVQDVENQVSTLFGERGSESQVFDGIIHILIENLVDSLDVIITGDTDSVVNWFVYENSFGANELIYDYDNGNRTQICNVDELIKYINENYDY